jgi:hypothetical protein
MVVAIASPLFSRVLLRLSHVPPTLSHIGSRVSNVICPYLCRRILCGPMSSSQPRSYAPEPILPLVIVHDVSFSVGYTEEKSRTTDVDDELDDFQWFDEDLLEYWDDIGEYCGAIAIQDRRDIWELGSTDLGVGDEENWNTEEMTRTKAKKMWRRKVQMRTISVRKRRGRKRN